MTSLQISPIGGVTAPSGASPTGDATSSSDSTAKSDSLKSAPAKPPSTAASFAAQAAQAAKAAAAGQADAQQAADAASARTDLRIETPPLNLSVGLIGGTFDVYVDLTDPTDNRVVARLYGPKGGTPEPPHPAPTKVHTEA